MFLRSRKNCSNIDVYHVKSQDLKERFRERGYPKSFLEKSRIWDLQDRTQILQKKERQNYQKEEDRVGMVTRYSVHWHRLQSLMNDHWHILLLDTRLEKILGKRPCIIVRKAPTIDDTLVRREFKMSIREPMYIQPL